MKTEYLSFGDYITEAFDKPYRFTRKVQYKGAVQYMFKTDDGGAVDVRFTENEISDDESSWVVVFTRNTSMKVTGEGDAMRIFATVISILKDFTKKDKPQELVFSAEKPAWQLELPKDHPKKSKELSSREKLYKRLVKRYAGSMGYKYTASSSASATDFRLVSK
jgi:hypothetical protein